MADAEEFTLLGSRRQFTVERHLAIARRDLRECLEAVGCDNLPELAFRQDAATEAHDGFAAPDAELFEIKAARDALVVLQVELREVLRELHQRAARELSLLHHLLDLSARAL